MTLANTLTILGLASLPLSASMVDSGQTQDGAKPDARGAEALIPRLGDQDYKARKEAYRALEQMGAKARTELEKALKSEDPEVRWSASLLLDRLDENEADGALGRLRARTDDELDEPAPLDPRGRAPRRAWTPRSIRTPEDAIDQMREAMRHLRMFEDPFLDLGNFGFDDLSDQGALDLAPGSSFSRVLDDNGRRESVSVKVDEKGHVTAEQEKDGEKLTFEADSIEALKKEHPELLQGFGGMRGGMNVRVDPFGRRAPKLDPRLPADPNEIQPQSKARRNAIEKPGADDTVKPGAPAPADRPRLGVQVAPVSADVARYLELEDGLGLEVVKVVPGSAAEKLGVKARDIITEVNGREIRSAEDVAAALGERDAATAEVTVIRRGAEKTLDHAK